MALLNMYLLPVLLCLVPIISCQQYMYSYKTLYYKQKLDHFSFTQDRRYPQRYLFADQFWRPGGPMFFYTGNEGDIEWFCNNTGLMWDLAPEYKALLVFAEHRYYGKSLPFGNDSFKNPSYTGFLSSEQALADFAELIYHLKHTVKGAEDIPVIAFGGSYGGMLSAWFRLKYPHVVAGAIAASAPVAQFTGVTPCNIYNRIVTKDFHAANPNCADNIRNSWNVFNELSQSKSGRKWLTDTWKLCDPLEKQEDGVLLRNWLTDAYGSLAMMDYPYPTNFVADLPGEPVKVVCSHLSKPGLSGKTLLSSLFTAINVYFNYTGSETCLNIKPSDATLGETGWDYQACTEMVMPMCSDGKKDMFYHSPWNFTEFSAGCMKKWKVAPQENMAVIMYGGRDLYGASNIVLSNGLLDPWSGGGILTNLSQSVISIIIPEGAHHLDLRASDPKDPQSVIQARKIERQKISEWIEEYHQR